MTPTILLIHHTHTDIGYTDPQGVVERWHVAYLRRALELVREVPGFRWQCETFRAVELFLAEATDEERQALIEAVGQGQIGLSASYLNLNELADQPLLNALANRAKQLDDRHGLRVRSAMTADINGHSWGFAPALLDAGCENLFACVHTHHGRYPLDRPQMGFWWEAPDGRRLLVWSGEHYHFGNELGLAPDAVSSYLTKDDCDAAMIYHDHWTVAERRIPRYLDKLRELGHSLDVVPIMISGLRTDNAPPTAAIAHTVQRWNMEHGDVCQVEMATLDQFFDRLRGQGADQLPVHRGDWPDWWSDGLASEPVSTRLFRQAQRDWIWLKALHGGHPELASQDLTDIETQLGLYAEHTFSHSDSFNAPWHELVQRIAGRKRAFAAVALDLAATELDRCFTALGGGPPAAGRPLRFQVTNPLTVPVTDLVPLVVEHYEYHERDLDGPVRLLDPEAGGLRPWQRRPVPRGMAFETTLSLEPGESRVLELMPFKGKPQAEPEPQEWADSGDLLGDGLHVAWKRGPGLTDLKVGGLSLLQSKAPYPPFALVHELTPSGGNQAAVRGAMHLNRKGPDETRSAAQCTGGRVEMAGPVATRHVLRFEGEGLQWCQLSLTAYQAEPVLDVSLGLHRHGTHDPENLYLPLPLTWPGAESLQVFKAGGAVRPWQDQIPGTVTDWTCLQEGYAWCGPDGGLVVTPLDSPLLWLGPLESGPRRLMGDSDLPTQPRDLHAWLATNYWETNFNTDLGGDLEFRFRLSWGADLADPEAARQRALALSQGLKAHRLDA